MFERQIRSRTQPLVALACIMMTFAPQVATAAERGRSVQRRKPAPQRTQRLVPLEIEQKRLGELIRNDDGTSTQRFSFGDTRFEYRFPADSLEDGASVLVTLSDSTGFTERWTISGAFLLGLQEYSVQFFSEAADRQLRFEQFELGAADRFEPADLLLIKDIGQALHERVDRSELENGARRLLPDLLQSHHAKSECNERIGSGLVSLGSTMLCWGSLPVTWGAHGAACVMLSATTALAGFEIAASCGGGGAGRGPGTDCDCRPPFPECMCCSLDPGDVCDCFCPGEACCDWENAPTPLREVTR